MNEALDPIIQLKDHMIQLKDHMILLPWGLSISNQSWLKPSSRPGGGVQSIPAASPRDNPMPEFPREEPMGAFMESWGAEVVAAADWPGEASDLVRFPLAQ